MSGPLERRQSRRRRHEHTRQGLIDAAVSLATRGSFKDLTVESIAREAGVARSGFYVYFGDKEELLLGALEDLVFFHEPHLGSCWRDTGDPRRDVERTLYITAETWTENTELLALAHEAATYDIEVRELWQGVLDTAIEGTREELARQQRAGAIADELDVTALAEGLVLMTERSFGLHLGHGEDREEVAARLVKVWWAALYGAAPLEPR